MSDTITASVLSASAVIIVGFVTLYANAKSNLKAKWRDQKIKYHTDFFDALSQYVGKPITAAKKAAFAREFNNLHLIASDAVLDRPHAFQEYCRTEALSDDLNRHNELLANLLNAIRTDLGVAKNNQLNARNVQLLSFRS